VLGVAAFGALVYTGQPGSGGRRLDPLASARFVAGLHHALWVSGLAVARRRRSPRLLAFPRQRPGDGQDNVEADKSPDGVVLDANGPDDCGHSRSWRRVRSRRRARPRTGPMLPTGIGMVRLIWVYAGSPGSSCSRMRRRSRSGSWATA
jgi:hypothetical protein